jgi:hypothetical protein
VTKDEAVKVLSSEWATCSDAQGLLTALEQIGVVKFDKPRREALLSRAAGWRGNGFAIGITRANIEEAARLIDDLAKELERGK